MLRVATVNVNGIRAAQRRGIEPWLRSRDPDVLCLQEVRAPDDVLTGILGLTRQGVHQEASAKGRAGVAVLSRSTPSAVRVGAGATPAAQEFAAAGRWVEADHAVDVDPGLLTVVSVYVPTGQADTPRQDEKYRFLDVARSRMLDLAADGRHLLVCGDFNVGHREPDIKNWKGNLKKAGFLPEERAWLDRLYAQDGFVDVHRHLAGEVPGPYTWWSWRGQAFDRDVGWRIDLQIATAGLAELALGAEVDRAPSYAERWSDHAPLVVDYAVNVSEPTP
ncbi:MAG: Exodeoxyribonuclease Xth [Actinomycetota bacterium]|nr:Exodeoxyribonuclease Xth [Actinomycetota bacterium]